MAESAPPHPVDHIDDLKAYEWMLAQCASAEDRRQALEDSLVGTIAQISSAAILAVPGFMFASEVRIPSFGGAPLLYFGLAGFGLALLSAMAEQHFSSLAYAKHVEVIQAYYTKQSAETQHGPSRSRVRAARWTAYAAFGIALLLTTISLMTM